VRKDSTAIVGAVVGLARALHLATVAEGIETREQLQHLRAMGCEAGQGYLFSPARPPEVYGTDPRRVFERPRPQARREHATIRSDVRT
jgi:EAL domain-containing protein (putative c-di-GMP-specific phosphodiesterase class I)